MPPLINGPFYSINISADSSPFYPIPGLTLGGLVVDEGTGRVAHRDGGTVPGLYAAAATQSECVRTATSAAYRSLTAYSAGDVQVAMPPLASRRLQPLIRR